MIGRRQAVFALGVAVLAGVVIWLAVWHRLILQRLLTELALPYGLVWIALSGLLVLSLSRRDRCVASLSAAAWLLHTASGTGMLANLLNRTLERPFAQIAPLREEPYDWVLVLGGSTEVGLNGQNQVNQRGDRLVLAARLYHAGVARQLIVSGRRTEGLSVDPTDPSLQARELLVELGVPADRIHRLAGRNTQEEMESLAALVKSQPSDSARIGLVTSAWHMQRALRLARDVGLQLEPLPAGFQSAPTLWPVASDVVPDADAAQLFTAACREYLARLAGR